LSGLATDTPVEWDLVKDIIPLEKALASQTATTSSSGSNKKPLPDHLVSAGILFDMLTGRERQKSDWQMGKMKEIVVPATANLMKLRNRGNINPTVKASEEARPDIDQQTAEKKSKQAKPQVLSAQSDRSEGLETAPVPTLPALDVYSPVTKHLQPANQNAEKEARSIPGPAFKLVWRSQGIE